MEGCGWWREAGVGPGPGATVADEMPCSRATAEGAGGALDIELAGTEDVAGRAAADVAGSAAAEEAGSAAAAAPMK